MLRPTAMILAGTAILLTGCKEDVANAPEIRPVEIVRPAVVQGVERLVYSGDVRARREQVLGFRLNGKIQKRLVEIGETVVPGQVLAELDPIDQQLAEATARADVASADAQVAQAAAELERTRTLVRRRFSSEAELDRSELAWNTAIAARDAANARLEQAANQTRYTRLTADQAGVVTATPGEVGTVVETGDPVVRVALSSDKEIRIDVPEQDVGRLAGASELKVTLWAEPGVAFKGTLREIAAAADPASRTFAVRIAVPGAPASMRLGMSAVVEARVPDGAAGLVLPLAAVDERAGQRVVWVVDTASNTVSTQPVTIGRYIANGFEITQGVTQVTPVVAAGGALLNEGQAVKVTGERTAVAELRP